MGLKNVKILQIRDIRVLQHDRVSRLTHAEWGVPTAFHPCPSTTAISASATTHIHHDPSVVHVETSLGQWGVVVTEANAKIIARIDCDLAMCRVILEHVERT